MQNGSCDPSCEYWVADYTYTAVCPQGESAGTLTVTRQGRSKVSYEDARRRARNLAKAEAEAELVCGFVATKCVDSPCNYIFEQLGSALDPICATVSSQVSLADAEAKAIAAATVAAAQFCASSVQPLHFDNPNINFGQPWTFDDLFFVP